MNSSSYNYNVLNNLNFRSNTTTSAVRNVIAVVLGLIIIYINGTLVHTFRKKQIFYMNPRYILYIHLVVNDMIQLTTSITLLVFSYTLYSMNSSLCLPIVVVAVFTTHNTPLNLAAMAVECYVAVCFPLRHAELCTMKRTYILIGCIWAFSSLAVVPDIFIHLATDPLWLFFSLAVCDKDKLLRQPVSIQKRDVSYVIYLTGVWLTLFITYFKIFFAAQKANSVDGNENKAKNTILLHGFQLLMCMLTYVDPMIKSSFVVISPEILPHLNYFWYVFVHILPRFISPMVYGLRDKTFRRHLKKYLLCNIRADNKLYPSGKLQLQTS